MGNTGCGKSTLTKHLSRHDEDMKAVLDGADFLINGSRIGSSIASVTQVPDLMTNKKDGIHYFDCPGFEDTRGSCVEVSTTYYMKDIVRHARRVKVLLLTPHFAVQRGQDRSDLLMMLKNAAQIFRNVAAVKDSLALVVTKVSGYVQVGDEWEPTPEDDVKAATADFLREDVLPFLKNIARSGEDRDLYSRAAEIINVLITKENGAYTRLGVFRSPDEEGSLRELDLMERGRDSLLELVKHNIKYSRVQPADFGFAVSDRTKVFAYKRARELSSEIVSKLSALGAAIQAGRTREARVAADVPAREARFTEAAQRVRGVAAHLKQSAGVQEFCGRVVDQMVQPEERSRAVEVAATCQQLDVLQVVGDKPLVDAATLGVQWVQPVQDAAAVLEAHRDWQRFLVAIHDRLNKYDALQPRKANVRHPPVGAHNAHHFELEVVKLGVATDLKSPFANLTELNALLEMASQGPSFECLPGGRVVVRGESVLLSEAAAAARTTCPGSMPLRVLEVYATYTVFVDVDVTLPGVHLVVVAPRLEAVGHPTVSLDGLPENLVAGQRQSFLGENISVHNSRG
ncbi:uncharacterized protein LOC117644728 [Thrips palmi]|uniref:Uncharacterized protein LOC117644728 n=1 Tax=Thrips palmi TaxID=161013 RepID=A0A6P8YK33_THRPL|nr:uncharacterized protein LOC117644728 [Thrips palmi]